MLCAALSVLRGMPVPEITWEIDHQRRLLIIRYFGDVTGEMAVSQIPEIWRRHPEVLTYNCLIDQTQYTGSIGIDDVKEISDQWYKFADGRDVGKRTAIVSTDEWTDQVVKAIAIHFKTQFLATFNTCEKAQVWLAEGGVEDTVASEASGRAG